MSTIHAGLMPAMNSATSVQIGFAIGAVLILAALYFFRPDRETTDLRSSQSDLERRAAAYDEIGEWLEARGYTVGTLVERIEDFERDLRHE